TAPEIRHVLVRNGRLEVQFTETPDLAAATDALQLNSAAVTWELSPDGYTLTTADALPAVSHTLTVGTGALDLAGNGLTETFSVTINPLTVSGTGFVFEEPDPREVAVTTTRNPYGFQGLPVDAETGLVYVRNRYFDPEIGRFISSDPLGFLDGPNLYAFALNEPINLTDPLGLQAEGGTIKVKQFYRPIYIQVEPIKSSTAWNEAEIELQLNTANRIFGEQAGVYVFWTRIKEDPDPKEALTAEGAQALLERAAFCFSAGTGGYEGLPIYYVRETSDNSTDGGRGRSPDYPTDRSRAAIVNRYWRGTLTNQYVTAHELGHAIGGLCDPVDIFNPDCRFGAPQPERGGVMNYPSPYDPEAQGEGLSEGEIKRLRRNARALATHPGGPPP
ncbi:MAG: RHS repeat-associated core domain-containing protein, partial [Acidobacteriota bacterium]